MPKHIADPVTERRRPLECEHGFERFGERLGEHPRVVKPRGPLAHGRSAEEPVRQAIAGHQQRRCRELRRRLDSRHHGKRRPEQRRGNCAAQVRAPTAVMCHAHAHQLSRPCKIFVTKCSSSRAAVPGLADVVGSARTRLRTTGRRGAGVNRVDQRKDQSSNVSAYTTRSRTKSRSEEVASIGSPAMKSRTNVSTSAMSRR